MTESHDGTTAAFLDGFRSYFGIADPVRPEQRLSEDLDFDSIQMFEIFTFLDEIAPASMPEELMAQIVTVADVLHHFETYAAQNESGAVS